jgi:hypothetical protein
LNKNNQSQNTGISPIVSGVVGAAAGAATVMLMNKDNQNKIKKVINKADKLYEKAENTADAIQGKLKKTKSKR